MNAYTVTTVAGGAMYRLSLLSGWNPTMNTVLAIDPGLRMGWALIAPADKTLRAGGFIELDRKHLYASGYNVMVDLLGRFTPTAVAFEQYFIGFGAHCKESIEGRGAMKAAVERAELPWQELHPSTVRANLGVKGKLKDAQIRDIVASLFGAPLKYRPDPLKKREVFFPSDVWDAVAVAWSADKMEGL